MRYVKDSFSDQVIREAEGGKAAGDLVVRSLVNLAYDLAIEQPICISGNTTFLRNIKCEENVIK